MRPLFTPLYAFYHPCKRKLLYPAFVRYLSPLPIVQALHMYPTLVLLSTLIYPLFTTPQFKNCPLLITPFYFGCLSAVYHPCVRSLSPLPNAQVAHAPYRCRGATSSLLAHY